jgi:hypothetical protein
MRPMEVVFAAREKVSPVTYSGRSSRTVVVHYPVSYRPRSAAVGRFRHHQIIIRMIHVAYIDIISGCVWKPRAGVL